MCNRLIHLKVSLSGNEMSTKKKTRNCCKFFEFNPENNERLREARNVLLVVVSLVGAATFSAGVNPPGGVWQDNGYGHGAGTAVFASQHPAYTVFMLSNTLAFSSSLLVIVALTYTFPFGFEIWVATVSMAVTYASAVLAVTPHESLKNRYIFFTAFVPFVLRGFIFLLHKILGCCNT